MKSHTQGTAAQHARKGCLFSGWALPSPCLPAPRLALSQGISPSDPQGDAWGGSGASGGILGGVGFPSLVWLVAQVVLVLQGRDMKGEGPGVKGGGPGVGGTGCFQGTHPGGLRGG